MLKTILVLLGSIPFVIWYLLFGSTVQINKPRARNDTDIYALVKQECTLNCAEERICHESPEKTTLIKTCIDSVYDNYTESFDLCMAVCQNCKVYPSNDCTENPKYECKPYCLRHLQYDEDE